MSRQKGIIINNLLKNWPKGTVVVYNWLKKQGIYRQLADLYVKSGWIERIGRGAFKRSGENIDWSGGVYALQTQLGMSVHPGGKTALEIEGSAQYLPADFKQKKIVLFGSKGEKLPSWFKGIGWEIDIRYVMSGLFGKDIFVGFKSYSFGNYEIKISSPERAALELCYDVPLQQSFDEMDQIMSGLLTLRPGMVQDLLEKCQSVKAKRLFMYIAEKHDHAWVGKIDLKRVDFGSGKRALCKNGYYDSKYKIVVPKK